MLVLVGGGQQQVLAHVGQKAIRSPQSAKSVAVYNRSARSSGLVTTRAVGRGVQRLGYFVSARGQPGTFVVGASQQLPLGKLTSVPTSSPDADLNFAIYFGRHPASRLADRVQRPPAADRHRVDEHGAVRIERPDVGGVAARLAVGPVDRVPAVGDPRSSAFS